MGKGKLTSEGQLLKLVGKDAKSAAVGSNRQRKSFLGLKGVKMLWPGLFKGRGRGPAKLKKDSKEPDLKTLNRILLVILIALLGYSIIDFVFGRPDIGKVYARIQPAGEEDLGMEIKSSAQPFLHYLEMVRRRNIFGPIVLKKPENVSKIKKQHLQDMAKDLNLVGISFKGRPMAMIENRAERKTYFLRKGDTIGKFKIEDILPNKVVLSYEGEKIDLM